MPHVRRSTFILTLTLGIVALGCDGGSDDVDGGGGDADCIGMDDGTACGTGLICVDEICVSSVCGDGFVDPAAGEECDDANDVAFDGCEPGACELTCTERSECDDGRTCNGAESCVDNVCASGTPPGDGAGCDLAEGGAGVCRAGMCVESGCGNGVPDGDEDCDDGNETNGDGCDNDCTFSCTMEGSDECSDGDVCNGVETCDIDTNACVAGEPLECDDGDECTANECDSETGCFFPLIDEDMDGHAPDSLACGTDCDDSDPDRFEGAEELCDGIDNDCNGIEDDGAPTWYVDCDGDGYASDTTGAGGPSCDPPSSPPAGCGGGGSWTSLRPIASSSTDCNDADPDARPDQTAYFKSIAAGGGYDYNCNGMTDYQYSTNAGVDGSASCPEVCFMGRCNCLGIVGWTSSTAPDCGESGTYSDCGRGCTRTTSTRTQRCR
ncbi:MAG TPA: MopE-related protein [Sandaracinaceae bacterium LLY-WYZ-13_1]|nr:MopE-related protein [Sandaracinaceae bacterium LLY-WYZ-13_1]